MTKTILKGSELRPEIQREALACYVHRYTGDHRPEWASRADCAKCPVSANTFETDLEAAIVARIKVLRADGTVGMSLGNLFQSVRPPASAPKGTNARYYYKLAFASVCERPAIRKFVISGGGL